MIHLEFAGVTDRGLARSRNEDCFVADAGLRLFAVVDGMGGHAAGDVASTTVAAAVTTVIRESAGGSTTARSAETDTGRSPLAQRLARAIRAANDRLAERARNDAPLGDGGATLAAALFGDEVVAIGHVGDCRAYLLRDGTLAPITRDHSLVAEQVALGLIDARAARTHPLRHVVTRAVSGQARVEVDVLEIAIRSGDRLLLCSDGVHGVLTDAEIASIVADRQRTLADLCRSAIDEVNRRGGPDNTTAVVIEVGCPPAHRRK